MLKNDKYKCSKRIGLNAGILQEGKDADIVVLNPDYSVDMTIVKGNIKYQA